jgi:tripartite-type tricarboxylate transporter receptor subunit TctC
VSYHTSGVKTFEDLKHKEIVVGAAGASSDDDQFPRVINGTLGTKMRVVSGYPGGNEITMALERGEVSGRCGWSWSSIKSNQSAWLADHRINLLAQLSLAKHSDLPDVPLIMDFAKTPEQTQILRLIFARQGLGRPFLAPPDLPAGRAAILRKAFADTMADPELLATADKMKIEIRPLTGEQVESLVKQVYRETAREVAKKAAAMLVVP